MFRAMFALSICAALAAGMGYVIVRALRTGAIRHSDMDSRIVRTEKPLRFWLLLAVFVAIDLWLCAEFVLIVRRELPA